MKHNALIWFRNDLRIDDNPALNAALSANGKLALFFRCEPQWRAFHMSEAKIEFIDRHVELLKRQLAHLGIELLIIDSQDFSEQQQALVELVAQRGITQVFANEELELNEKQRDLQLIENGLNLSLFSADTIVTKGAILNKEGKMYRVFSAFRKAWLSHVQTFGFEHQPCATPAIVPYQESSPVHSKKWPLVTEVTHKVLPNFIATKLADYETNRDFPGVKGTSGLSPYLAIGAISVRSILRGLLEHADQSAPPMSIFDPQSPAFSWLNELIWRDFYRHLLFHYPDLIKGKSFNSKYDQLQWPYTGDNFELWCAGKTGFPIIDAAMRQLLTTGWMHNRLRMIVASFLTKNLLVNWRRGETFFMAHLIDGDFAANNGGWQWSAGTGCDAQPYFRVFNPLSQSKKFDPNGDFIRKYLPELKDVPDKHIHSPQDYLGEIGQGATYWPQIVDLKQSRLDAIAFYGMK